MHGLVNNNYIAPAIYLNEDLLLVVKKGRTLTNWNGRCMEFLAHADTLLTVAPFTLTIE